MKSMTQKLLPLFALITLSAHPISFPLWRTKPQPSLFSKIKAPALKTAAATAMTYGAYKLAHYFACKNTKPFVDNNGNSCYIEEGNTAHMAGLASQNNINFSFWRQQQQLLLDANTELLPWDKRAFTLSATAGFLNMLAIKKIVTSSMLRKYSTPKQLAIVLATTAATTAALHVCPVAWLNFYIDQKILLCYPNNILTPYYFCGATIGALAFFALYPY